jgi:hypothetical protein
VGSSEKTRPDTQPAALRIRVQRGYVDASKVVTVPFAVKNFGLGEAWNVKVLVQVRNEALKGVVPESVSVGDIKPGKKVSSQLRFRLPRNIKSHEIILVFQPKDESPQNFRKVRTTVPLNVRR